MDDNVINKRNALEGLYTAHRINELRVDPVQGSFDASHLREINRRIFQDMPGAGFTDVTPGQYRPPTPKGKDWIKQRKLESVGISPHVAYSPMDNAAQARLDNLLKDINPTELAKLKTAEFTQTIGTLYTELDYIHPFSDGNSRTLREFTRQLAKKSGYELDWDRFNRSPAGRDILYIARDQSVNKLAMPHIQHDDTRRNIVFSTDQLEGNRNLPELLKDAIRPSRAVAFEQLPKDEAIEKHPDLAEAYKTLHLAGKYFETKMPGNTTAQHEALVVVKKHIQIRLDGGETRDFRNTTKEQQKEKTTQVKSREDNGKILNQNRPSEKSREPGDRER